MTFTAIVTAHEQDPGRILGNLMYQTRKPDEIIVLHSGLDHLDVRLLEKDFPAVTFVQTMNMGDWGHDKRARGLALATGDAIGFFNADDSYDLSYIERLMAKIEAGSDVAYCAWNTIPHCSFRLQSSTSGNYIVRTSIARAAGYTDRHYEADGTFINRIGAITRRIARIDDVLYFHNEVR